MMKRKQVGIAVVVAATALLAPYIWRAIRRHRLAHAQQPAKAEKSDGISNEYTQFNFCRTRIPSDDF